ncbi:hypothetical protein DOX62_015660 [Cronobacter dublinensis]
METVKKSFTPPANNPLLLPDIALPVFLAISFPQKRERRELQGRQHIKKDYPRGAGLRHRYCGAVAVTLLCGERFRLHGNVSRGYPDHAYSPKLNDNEQRRTVKDNFWFYIKKMH